MRNHTRPHPQQSKFRQFPNLPCHAAPEATGIPKMSVNDVCTKMAELPDSYKSASSHAATGRQHECRPPEPLMWNSQTTLGRMLAERGFETRRVTGGTKVRTGISLRSVNSSEQFPETFPNQSSHGDFTVNRSLPVTNSEKSGIFHCPVTRTRPAW